MSFLISHSHIIKTFQPKDKSSLVFLLSRSMFLSNLSCQNATLLLGKEGLQCGHRCQKHPLTKMATFHLGKAMSGLPGAFFQ